MASPTRDKKPKLSRRILEDENVFFYDHVHQGKDLPDWLRPIRRQMRHARTKPPRDSRKLIKAELEGFQYSGQDRKTALTSSWSLKPLRTGYSTRESFSKESSALETEIEKALDDCLRVKKLAIRLRERNELEPHWVTLLRTEFFKTYMEVHDTKDEHRDLFNQWELHVDVRWNECLSRKNLTSQVRTEPKPDLAYSFPIIDPMSKVAKLHRFDPRVENFTLPVLSELRKTGGVIPSPKSSLQNCDPKKLDSLGASDLACFPWAIVEVKTSPWNGNKELFCYCQAANGSAEALIMREKLAEKIDDPSNDALVIFSFTCVGPSVRLWLTFRHPTSRNIEMCCIWATSLELTWGVFALRMVIENMRKWVYERVKPEICRWISHIRSHLKPQTVLAPNGDQVEQRRRARSFGPPPDERPTVSPSVPPRPASHSKITPTFSKENTVPRRARSPSPLSRLSARPTTLSDEVGEDDTDEEEYDEHEDDCEHDAYDSGDDGSYVPSDDASSDDDGYTTVEEETYDTSEDEDEPDEGYSSDRAYKSLNEAEFVLRLRGHKTICR